MHTLLMLLLYSVCVVFAARFLTRVIVFHMQTRELARLEKALSHRWAKMEEEKRDV